MILPVIYKKIIGPYVEYLGKIPEKSDDLAQKISDIANKYIKETPPENSVQVNFYNYEQAKTKFEVPEHLPKDATIRYINLFDKDPGCPCGGTHVKHISDINEISVTKIQKKGKNVRVSYKVK